MRVTLTKPAVLLAVAMTLVAGTAAQGSTRHAVTPPVGVDSQCFAHTTRIDPMVDAAGTPTNPAWIARDAVNQYCATLRLRDQANPAWQQASLTLGATLYADRAQEQVADGPGHVHGGLTTLIPGALAADPFRSLSAWEQATGGTATSIVFHGLDGAQLRGHLWLPPKSVPKPKGGYPGVVITDGSIQAYENLYYWAAEGLAQYGYEVMTYDVQGQGHSDLLPASCTPSSCPGVPYQQNYNFYQGAEDSLSWFDSPANPGFSRLNADRIGIAGHSAGAAAVTWVGQCDSRVKAVVAWDDLGVVDPSQCAANVTIPKRFQARNVHAPALANTNDYEFNIQPATKVPNPHGDSNAGGLNGDSGYLSLAKAGVDSELVSFRNGTHLTYSYVDLVLPSNELSERFSFYYTLAWFDEYLRAGSDPYTQRSAFARLTNLGAYDDSADRNSTGAVSIGAGTYDPAAGNVPYAIKGISVPDSLSFYYFSGFRLTNPRTRAVVTCSDLLALCPKVQPSIP